MASIRYFISASSFFFRSNVLILNGKFCERFFFVNKIYALIMKKNFISKGFFLPEKKIKNPFLMKQINLPKKQKETKDRSADLVMEEDFIN